MVPLSIDRAWPLRRLRRRQLGIRPCGTEFRRVLGRPGATCPQRRKFLRFHEHHGILPGTDRPKGFPGPA
eukprot:7618581-Pyramimonas_sp.AAC.1